MTQRPEPYERYRTAPVYDALEALGEQASERGVAMAALALAWTLAQPDVTAVVVGPRRPGHLDTARTALDLRLSRGEADAIAGLFD